MIDLGKNLSKEPFEATSHRTGSVDIVADRDDVVWRILTTYGTITVVAAGATARAIAEAAGLLYVEDRCMSIGQRRLDLAAPGR